LLFPYAAYRFEDLSVPTGLVIPVTLHRGELEVPRTLRKPCVISQCYKSKDSLNIVVSHTIGAQMSARRAVSWMYPKYARLHGTI